MDSLRTPTSSHSNGSTHNHHYSQAPFAAPFNVVARLTAGLGALHRELQEGRGRKSACFRTSSGKVEKPGEFTLRDGSLRLPNTLSTPTLFPSIHSYPLLARRYKFVKVLGVGGFSQTLLARDTYHPEGHVYRAIKVMGANYGVIGREEAEKLRSFNKTGIQEAVHIVKIFGTFTFFGHFCLVLEVLHRSDKLVVSGAGNGSIFVNGPIGRVGASNRLDIGHVEGDKRNHFTDMDENWRSKTWASSSIERHSLLTKTRPAKSAFERSIHSCEKGFKPNSEFDSKARNSPTSMGFTPPHIFPSKDDPPASSTAERWYAPCALPIPMSEENRLRRVRKIAFQIATTLLFLGRMDIIHADLKPDNIMRISAQSDRIKVIDFGNAMRSEETHFYYDDFAVQSLLYRAPELLMGLPFGLPIDMWSFGCLLCEAWIGLPLFSASTRQGIIRQIIHLLGPLPVGLYHSGEFFKTDYVAPEEIESIVGDLHWQAIHRPENYRRARLSQLLNTRNLDYLNFLSDCLDLDPSSRLTPQEALSHPFLSSLFPFRLLATAL